MRIPSSGLHLTFFGAVVVGAVLLAGSAKAAIPSGYTGLPFDPAVAGGAGIIPPTVKAGPYAIPGRIDFVNYDMGGEQITFHAGDHITNKAGAGYRKDGTVATFSKTSMAQKDVWYMSGTAMDGTTYPNATTQDFYIGAVQVNDWFNFTVNVQTAGTYVVSSTWSSGNGPPGGEGGDGAMGLQIYANGTKLADWKSTWPDFNTTADFHHWKPYPNFAMVTLEAGIQVIKLQPTSKHLNLDYVQFDLMGADGGAGTGAGGATDGGATGAGGGAGGNGMTSGAAGTTGAAGTGTMSGAAGSGTSGAGGATGAAGDGAGGSASAGSPGTTGAAGGSGAGTAGTGGTTTGAAGTGPGLKPGSGGGCSCTFAGTSSRDGSLALCVSAIALALVRRRRRR